MRVRVRKRWLVPVVLLGAAALTVPPVLAEDSAANCASGYTYDLNADGVEDVVVGRPEESVDGAGQAGAVAVLYGAGKGTRLITQNTPDLAGTAESGDQFGKVVVVADVNSDYCGDIVVSAPYEAVGTKAKAGAVWVIPGSPTGLDVSAGYVISQDSPGIPGTAEAGDEFGRAIDGSHYGVLVGAPGEDHHAVNSGSVYVIADGSAIVVHQDTPGVPGTQEEWDRFGEVVAAGAPGMIVGVPHESVGSAKGAGMVHVFSLGDGSVKPGRAYTQNDSDVGGTSESGDHFGDAIATGSFTSGTDGFGAFAVGAPDEDLGSEGYLHGMVHVFVVSDFADAGREAYTVHQNTYGVAGEAESGDRFGSGLAIGSTPSDPEDDGASHLMVTVLSGGEDLDIEQGRSPAIQVFEGTQDIGHDDRWIKAGEYGLPADADLSPRYATARHWLLFLSAADGAPVYGVPTGNIAFGETNPVARYGA